MTYSKSASLIRMLIGFIGEAHFQTTISQYLKGRMFGTACSDDLWEVFEQVTGSPIGTMMKSWTSVSG